MKIVADLGLYRAHQVIAKIFPWFGGHLNDLAVRVLLLNTALTDIVFEALNETCIEGVNALFRVATNVALSG